MSHDPGQLARAIIGIAVPGGGVATITLRSVLEIARARDLPLDPEADAPLLEAVFDAIAVHPRFVMEADEGRVRCAASARTLRLRGLFRPEPAAPSAAGPLAVPSAPSWNPTDPARF